MTIAPHSGIIDFGTFTPPTASVDGIQGEVPAPLIAEAAYVLSATGWIPMGGGGGGGTVTSIAASGGTTGLTFTGSPITTSGTLTLGGTLAVANGGTGATSAAAALTSLGAYPASNPSGFTSNVGTVTSANLTAGTGISVSGGPITTSGSITVVNTAPDQIVSLTAGTNVTITGTYPSFTIAASGGSGGGGTVTSVDGSGGTTGLTLTGGPITTSGTLTLGGTLAIANGGTGATSAAAALTSLGAYPASNPSGFTSNTGTVTSVAGTGTVNGITLTGSITASGSLTLGGTLSGVSLTTQVSGTLPVANGGTGATTLTGYVKGTGTAALTASASIPTSDISGGAALTEVDDTNVTLTLGGSPTTALLAATSITAGWSGQLAVGRGGTGASTLTGIVVGNGTSAFTTVTAPSGAIVGTTDTQTLTNKRVTPRMNSQSSTSSPWAWNSDSYDIQAFTALANALTINADAGTPTDGQRTVLRFKDDGTARALTWTTGSAKAFRAIGVTLPTTTVVGKTVYVGCLYNSFDSRWDAVAVSQEA